METNPQPEVWMRGPVSGVSPLLQPVAHALLQAVEESSKYIVGFDDRYLWEKPMGMASVGFHLQHMTGVVDRLFTYALGKSLAAAQLDYLRREGISGSEGSAVELVVRFRQQVDMAIEQLKQTEEAALADERFLGRKLIPTTLIGLLFHAAEHIQRHIGQMLVTVKIIESVKS